MASSSSSRILLLLLPLLAFLSIGGVVNARPGVHFHPCKTIFISSFTISSAFKPPQNPNHQPLLFDDKNPTRFFSILKEFKDFYPNERPLEILVDLDRRPFFDLNSDLEFQLPRSIPIRSDSDYPEIQRDHVVPFGSFGVSSIRDRTKDILSVVVALLFGVGCGALTSATMYLAWSLITNRYEARESGDDFSDSDFDDDDDDVASAKKLGYTKIPESDAQPVVATVPAQAKEVV